MNYSEYKTEIESLAKSIVEEVLEGNFNGETTDDMEVRDIINDTALHETIDGHQWIIYTGYNIDVIKNSDNESYAADNFGGEYLADVLKNNGYDQLNTTIAFWCMYADVIEEIHKIIGDMIAEHND